MMQRSLSILKPDITAKNLTGRVNARIEEAGLRIIAQKRVVWTREQAEAFYAEHRARPFFSGLVDFMTSGPVVLQVLEGDRAIERYRQLMGATNPADALPGTLRQVFATSIEANAVHGSDSEASAAREIALNFESHELVG
jgi:nucleoside-diphosphate kinase